MFFINHQQPQVLELGRFTQQFVCAHHNVHGAIGQTFERLIHLFGRAKARHLCHLHRPLRKAIFQRLEMLLGQQGGGRQNRHLLATRHGHKGCAQGHLGFAKAHIATNQTVHGAGADHVLNHGMNCGVLVGCFAETKVIGKDFVVLWAVSEGMAFARCAARVDVEQFCGGVSHLLGRFSFGFFPLTTAQAVQRRFIGTHTGVAANQLQLADGHIQRGFVGVFQMQKLLQGGRAVWVLLTQVHVHQTAVAANAVGVVHHRVAHVELRQIFDQRFNIADLFLFFTATRGDTCCKQFGLCDQINACFKPVETSIQGGRGNAYFFVTGLKFLQIIKGRRADAASSQKVEQTFSSASTLGQNQDAMGCASNVRLKFGQRFFRTAYHREVGQGLRQCVVCVGICTLPERQLRMLVSACVELLSR